MSEARDEKVNGGGEPATSPEEQRPRDWGEQLRIELREHRDRPPGRRRGVIAGQTAAELNLEIRRAAGRLPTPEEKS